MSLSSSKKKRNRSPSVFKSRAEVERALKSTRKVKVYVKLPEWLDMRVTVLGQTLGYTTHDVYCALIDKGAGELWDKQMKGRVNGRTQTVESGDKSTPSNEGESGEGETEGVSGR